MVEQISPLVYGLTVAGIVWWILTYIEARGKLKRALGNGN